MKLTTKQYQVQALTRSSLSKQGFTIIEVIVVIAIIITLSGIGFGVFFKMNEKARASQTQVIIDSVAAAMEGRALDITRDQRDTFGLSSTFPEASSGDDNSTVDLVSYISGDFDGDGETDDGVETKLPQLVANDSDSNQDSYLDDDGRIVDGWGNPIQYTFPGVYHNEDDGFDLVSAGPDKEFGTEDDIILK